MSGTRLPLALFTVVLAATGPALAWSILDEVTVLDPSLSVQMDWEMPVAKTYCQSLPQNLDRLACEIRETEEFWFGSDGAGSRYGVIKSTDPNGDYFDVYRRPAGTQVSEHLLRITARTEPIFGEVTKIQVAGSWEVDPSNGEMTLTFRGQCLTAACTAESDTGEHLGTLRVSGLPGMFAIAATFDPGGAVAFRLPSLPETLARGSTIDIFAGPLGTLPDLSHAQVLECDVAAGLAPGELVTYADPLPAPSASEGRYYLAAVTDGADSRAGRRHGPGGLVGRDPGGLPFCP